MPVFTEGHDPLDAAGRDLVTPIAAPDPKPSYDRPDDPLPAAFRQSNPVVSVIEALRRSSGAAYDPDHNPLQAIQGTKYANEPDLFVGSGSEAETRSLMARIDQQERDRETLAANGFAGTAASVVAGLLDPTMFIAAGGVVKAARGGYSVLRSGASAAGAGVLQAGVSELALNLSQVGRPTDDVPWVLGSSALLGGLIGVGASALLNRVERAGIATALDADRAALSADAGLPKPVSAGAAASDVRTMAPTPLVPDAIRNLVPPSVRDTAARWLMSWSPTQRTFFARDSIEARKAMAELTELAFDFEDHAAGITTTRDGLAPVGTLAKMTQTRHMIDAGDQLEKQFLTYRYGADDNGAAAGSMTQALREDLLRGGPAAKLSFSDFKAEVAKALRADDTHEIPEVQQVAQHMRSSIFDPLQRRLVEAGLMSAEDAVPRGDRSFLTRAWDKRQVAERRPELHRIVTDWLQGEQAAKAGQKARIGAAVNDRRMIEQQLRRVEHRLGILEGRNRDTVAQLKERAVELNGADAREAAMAGREQVHADSIAELQDFIDTMRETARDPDSKMRLDQLEQELAVLREAERQSRPSPTALDGVDTEERAATLQGDMKTAAEVFVGRRNAPQAESFLSYLTRYGGVADEDARAVFRDIRRPGLVRNTRDHMGRSGTVVRSIDDWGEKLHEDFPAAFPERPDRATVLAVMHDAAQGREPWFMHFGPDGSPLPHVRVGELEDTLSDLFERLGLARPQSVKDVVRALNSDKRITLQDLIREAEEMDAAGAAVPPRAALDAQERLVDEARQARAEVRRLLDDAIANRRGAERDRMKAGIRADEARVAVTRSENRFEALQAHQERQQMMRDLLEAARDNAKAEHARLTKAIEDEVRQWKGHSSGEAIAALASRDEAERIRALKEEAGVYNGSGKRMASADRAVARAVKRMLATDQDLSGQELQSRAQEIIDRILGSPDGRLPYDAASNAAHIVAPQTERRGSLMARDFAIPSNLVDGFLNNDVDEVLHQYLRTIVPDLLLHERFGDVEMTSQFRALNEEYAAKALAAKTDQQRARIENDRQAAIRDLAAVRDRVRNIYGWPQQQAMPITASVARVARSYNTVTDLGTSTLNSLPDMAGAVFQHGLQAVIGDGWAPFLKAMTNRSGPVNAAMKRQAKDMLIALETKLNLRSHAVADIVENHKPGSRFERALRWTADKSQILNFQAPWTDTVKSVAATVATAEHIRAIERTVAGNGTAADAAMLARSNINEAMAGRIYAAYKDGGGEVIDGTPFVDVAKWKDRDAATAFTAAMMREADIAVVTPGLEKPLAFSNPVFALLGQFKSFIGATHERLMIPALQRRDAKTLAGLFSSIGAGMLSYKLYALVSGRETSERPQDWIKEGISRGGVLGWFDEINNSGLAKLSSGRLDIYRLIGADRPMSRFEQRTTAAALLGPTWGKVEGLVGASGAAFRGEWSRSDTTRLRRMVPLQNLFYLRHAIGEAEAGVNDAFGVPARAS